jgi:hypothetical protein
VRLLLSWRHSDLSVHTSVMPCAAALHSAALVQLGDPLDHVVDVALGVDAVGDGEANEAERRPRWPCCPMSGPGAHRVLVASPMPL